MTAIPQPATDSPPPRVYELSLGAIIWVAAGALFMVMRLAGVLSIPVGGIELSHLSGAWEAKAGNTDARFIPTLFQGLAAWSFEFTRADMPARVLALVASLGVPLSLYRLRPLLTEPAALLGLLILTFDPVSILLGSTAWAGALDVIAVLWVLQLARRDAVPSLDLGLAGFVASTAGATVLPFFVAVLAVRLFRQEYPSRAQWPVAVGVAAGVVAASFGFGHGWQGLTLSPVQAFATGFEHDYSTESTGYLALLYATPVVVGGLAAAGWRISTNLRTHEWPENDIVLLTWGGLSLAWVVAAAGEHDPTPIAGAALPLALLLARELPHAFAAIAKVEWRWAAWALAALIVLLFIVEAFVVDWARIDRPGTSDDKLVVAGLVVALLAVGGILASNRATAPSLLIPPILVLALPLVSGAFAVATGSPNEPLPSPISTVQGEELRDIALAASKQQGGAILIHSDFREQMSWPFRDSGDILVATSSDASAVVAIWPATEPAPEGFSILDGTWGFLEVRHAPSGDFLDYLRWLSNRNVLRNTFVPVAVYLRTAQ